MLLAVVPETAHAQDEPADASVDHKLPFDPGAEPQDVFVLPGVFFSPETSVLFVLGLLYYFDVEDTHLNVSPARAAMTRFGYRSSVQFAATYTLKQQVVLEAHPIIYWGLGDWLFAATNFFWIFPERFYGVGNASDDSFEDWVSERFSSELKLQRRIVGGLFGGLFYDLQFDGVSDPTPGGTLDRGLVPGADGNIVSGLGVGLEYDSRDNDTWPRHGFLASTKLSGFLSMLGSSHEFMEFTSDLRAYVGLPAVDHVLALRASSVLTHGDVPFARMPRFGGKRLVRAFYDGRYRDDNVLALQAEYRIHLWWRIGLVAFFGMGQVAESVDSFDLTGFHPGGGAGIRLGLDEASVVNLRFDVAASSDFLAVHFTLLEAF